MEEWKDVVYCPDFYEVSNLGNVRSKNRVSESYGGRMCSRKGRNRKFGGDRYALVDLCIEGERKTYSVHRLVALAFIPNPENLPEVDHIDRNTRNNCVSNLRWVSKCENQANRGIPKNNKSGEKYISYPTKSVPYFRVQWTKNGVHTHKYCSTFEEAKLFRFEHLGF